MVLGYDGTWLRWYSPTVVLTNDGTWLRWDGKRGQEWDGKRGQEWDGKRGQGVGHWFCEIVKNFREDLIAGGEKTAIKRVHVIAFHYNSVKLSYPPTLIACHYHTLLC